MALVANGPAPYAPPRTVIDIVERYRDRGLTVPITTEVLERAGVPESLSQRTLQTLKLLDFVRPDGSPSHELEQLSRAPDSEWKQGLADLLTAAYSEVFAFADPATDNIDRIRDAFRAYNPRGQQERMVTLFLGLLEWAELDVGAAVASKKTAAVEARPAKVAGTRSNGHSALNGRFGGRTSGNSRSSGSNAVASGLGDLPAGLVGLLHQIPLGGAAWSQTRRDEFLRAFAAVLDFSVPVADDVHPQAPATLHTPVKE